MVLMDPATPKTGGNRFFQNISNHLWDKIVPHCKRQQPKFKYIIAGTHSNINTSTVVAFEKLILYREYFIHQHKIVSDFWTFSIPLMEHHLIYIINFGFHFLHVSIIFYKQRVNGILKKVPKCPDSGILLSELLSFWTLSTQFPKHCAPSEYKMINTAMKLNNTRSNTSLLGSAMPYHASSYKSVKQIFFSEASYHCNLQRLWKMSESFFNSLVASSKPQNFHIYIDTG